MKPIIKYKENTKPRATYITLDEKKIILSNTLYGNGRTTHIPQLYAGITREIDGYTWWLVHAQYIPETGVSSGENFGIDVMQHTEKNQRKMLKLTDSEEKKLKLHNFDKFNWGVFIREDSTLWGIMQDTANQIDNAIDDYIEHDYTAPWNRHTKMPGKTKKTGIGIKKLTNYSNIKILAKINEIIEFLEEKYGN